MQHNLNRPCELATACSRKVSCQYPAETTHGPSNCVHVSPLRSILQGLPVLEALELIKFTDSVSCVSAIRAVYPQLFGTLGAMKEEHNIRLKQNSIPFAIQVARRIAFPLRDRVKQELERMERDEVIRKVDEPIEWCGYCTSTQTF